MNRIHGIERMLISHRYNFIFIKTIKTAGTSIEIALSRFLGPKDVITPISPEDEVLRAQAGYPGPQNCHVPLKYWDREDWKRLLRARKRPVFFNHMAASEVKARVPRPVWEDYFKFCFERNPWDKVISWYYWEHPEPPRPSLREFIESGKAQVLADEGGRSLYTVHGEPALDRIYRYEDLAGAMTDLATRIGLPEVPVLPRAKSRFRKDRRPYQQVYGNRERDLVAATFAREIAALGYSFEHTS